MRTLNLFSYLSKLAKAAKIVSPALIFFTALVGVSPEFANALEEAPSGNFDGTYFVDLKKYCSSFYNCSKNIQDSFVSLRLATNNRTTLLASNVDIVGVSICRPNAGWAVYLNYSMGSINRMVVIESKGDTIPGYQHQSSQALWTSRTGLREVEFTGRSLDARETENSYICGVYLSNVDLKISSDLTAATWILIRAYKVAYEQLINFENNMNNQSRRHVQRLKAALAKGLQLMTADNKALISALDVRLLENLRVVMVLITVLDKVLEDWAVVVNVKRSIEILREFNQEIRKVTGWGSNFVGTGSKSYAALSEIIDLDLKDLYGVAASLGQMRPDVFNEMIRANQNLGAATKAAKGGDAVVASRVVALANVWNSTAWQNILHAFFQAPPDYNSYIQMRLLNLVTEIEALQDLSNVNFVVSAKIESLKAN